MDAIRIGLLVSLSLIGVACSQSKTSESVFPNNAQALCGGGAASVSQERFIVQWEDGRFTVETDSSAEKFRSGFVKKKLSLIKHVDHDVQVHLSPADTISQSEELQAMSGGLNWQITNIKADQLWAQNINGEGIIVAVVDGMVDVNHPQLRPNILVNNKEIPNNGLDDDGNGFVDDYMGVQINVETNDPAKNTHGSHVAGIIAADSSSGGAIEGIAPKAKILPAQFIGNNEAGSIGDAITAMNYAAMRGAKIINMSWGLQSCDNLPTLQAALQQLSNKGILLVTAAGNGDRNHVGYNTDFYPMYPGAYNLLNQLNVAASTANDFLTGFSNYGVRTVHVAAPGNSIFSTVPGNTYAEKSGTSMASPATAGAAALIWSAIPSATATQIKQAIMRGVDIMPGSNTELTTRGRINVSKAYLELRKITGQ